MPRGDCYEAAFHRILRWSPRDPEETLVHGIVTGQGHLDGVRYGHAWTEIFYGIETVIDDSNDRHLVIPKGLYYAAGKIKAEETIRYTREEAQRCTVTHDHFGPWDDSVWLDVAEHLLEDDDASLSG